jgi:hypothetical protein
MYPTAFLFRGVRSCPFFIGFTVVAARSTLPPLMGNLKKKRRLKMNKHKRRKRLKSHRHKKRTWQK